MSLDQRPVLVAAIVPVPAGTAWHAISPETPILKPILVWDLNWREPAVGTYTGTGNDVLVRVVYGSNIRLQARLWTEIPEMRGTVAYELVGTRRQRLKALLFPFFFRLANRLRP